MLRIPPTRSFAFVVKGPSLIKIISARNQDIIMVYEALLKVDINEPWIEMI
jgi:hypothetical protein